MSDFGRRAGAAAGPHKTTHQDGGTDEVSIAGLSGQAADDQPAAAHDLGGTKHSSATLAQLNAKVSDATLDDSGDPRTPSGHKVSHQDGGADEIDCSGLVGAGGIATYGMRVVLVGVQDVPVGVWTRINLDTIDYDNYPGGSFNTTTHQWTCPALGQYALALSGGFNPVLPDGVSIGVLMRKNDVLFGPYVRFCTGAEDYIRIAAADIQQIAQDDVYDMWIRHDSGAPLDLLVGTQYTNYLAIHRMS